MASCVKLPQKILEEVPKICMHACYLDRRFFILDLTVFLTVVFWLSHIAIASSIYLHLDTRWVLQLGSSY